MDRDPGDFPRDRSPTPAADLSNDGVDAWLATLPPAPGVPSSDAELDAALARAEADVAAGRVHTHEVVSAWLETMGTPEFKPLREWRG